MTVVDTLIILPHRPSYSSRSKSTTSWSFRDPVLVGLFLGVCVHLLFLFRSHDVIIQTKQENPTEPAIPVRHTGKRTRPARGIQPAYHNQMRPTHTTSCQGERDKVRTERRRAGRHRPGYVCVCDGARWCAMVRDAQQTSDTPKGAISPNSRLPGSKYYIQYTHDTMWRLMLNSDRVHASLSAEPPFGGWRVPSRLCILGCDVSVPYKHGPARGNARQ